MDDNMKWPVIGALGILLIFVGSHTAIAIWGNPKNIEADKTTIGIETKPECEVCCQKCKCNAAKTD